MKRFIEDFYDNLGNENDFILTHRARIKYDELVEKWNEISTNSSEKEKGPLDDLYSLSNELINICCIDHFTKGFRIGTKVTADILFGEKNEEDFSSTEIS